MSIASLFRRNPHREAARRLYAAIVERAREPILFTRGGIPDTLDGRFEMLALHAFLVFNRLRIERRQSTEFAQELFDAMFTDMDRSLREMGVGDLGVGRQVKHMAKAFYGRIASYEKGLTVGGKRLDEAMRRNLYGTVSPGESEVATMADYARDCARSLAAQPAAALLSGTVEFAPLPDFAAAPGLPEMLR